MMRTLIIGVATAGLLASVAGCSTSTGAPRWGYVGPDNTPGWKGQNFYAYQNGYVALNYTNDDEYKVITICTPQPKLVEPGPSGAAGRVGLAGPPGPAGGGARITRIARCSWCSRCFRCGWTAWS
jgi:hypothetical protein